jgi:hypothetical protein
LGLIAPSNVKRQNKGDNNDGNSDNSEDDDEDLFNMDVPAEKKEEIPKPESIQNDRKAEPH